jgi:hypothetical protein
MGEKSENAFFAERTPSPLQSLWLVPRGEEGPKNEFLRSEL